MVDPLPAPSYYLNELCVRHLPFLAKYSKYDVTDNLTPHTIRVLTTCLIIQITALAFVYNCYRVYIISMFNHAVLGTHTHTLAILLPELPGTSLHPKPATRLFIFSRFAIVFLPLSWTRLVIPEFVYGIDVSVNQ